MTSLALVLLQYSQRRRLSRVLGAGVLEFGRLLGEVKQISRTIQQHRLVEKLASDHSERVSPVTGMNPTDSPCLRRKCDELLLKRPASIDQSRAYKIEMPGSETRIRLTTRCFREIQ